MAGEGLIADFWDVGQGDATILRLPTGELVIIDVGPKGSPIIDWLDRHPVIHAVVLTHNDEDHAGGLLSLVRIPGIAIRTVYMLQDRDKRSEKFRNIWRPVREEERKGRLSVVGLARDTVIWASGDLVLKAVYPGFSENVEAVRPNESSAVVCLLLKGEVKIIWPGDAPMRVVAEKCANALPYLLHGPHHGGPVDRKQPGFGARVESVLPERVLISVGTHNRYSLPAEEYLRMQAGRGARVNCTQLTRLCDPQHVTAAHPVLETAALLGLRPARTGVPCRGCLRLKIRDGAFLADPFDAEHSRRVRALRRPKCVLTARA